MRTLGRKHRSTTTLHAMSKTNYKLIIIALLSFLVAACGAGPSALTNSQDPTGSGRYFDVGPVQIQNAVIVSDGTNSKLVMNAFNNSDTPQTILAISVAGQPVVGNIQIPPVGVTSTKQSEYIEIVITGLNPPMSQYVQLQVEFETLGIATTEVLVVPNEGQFAEISFDETNN